MTNKLVTILIPTLDNEQYLRPCITSILRNRATAGLFEVLVINNGHPRSCDYLKAQREVKVINSGQNLGWEGGLDLGLKNSESPFVVFMNDDTLVPHSSRLWLNQLLQHFKNEKVGAVGPSSNVVMGFQNIFADLPYQIIDAKFIIGFCAMLRRKAFDEIGGMDMSLPGGDDLDWSIRLRDAGYRIYIDRSVFIFHHGFKTGDRVHGGPSAMQGWNSWEMYHKTTQALIKKHGMKKWWDLMKGTWQLPKADVKKIEEDKEGKTIKKLIRKDEKTVLDLGCGPRKTLKRALGIDFVKKGEKIPTLDGEPISEADVDADVGKELPFDDNTVDVIIARHILEHMIDPIMVMEHWMRKLKKGGRIIVAAPNEEWNATIPMNTEHFHAYTPRSMIVFLTAMGFKNVEIKPSGNGISFLALGVKT